MKNLVMAVILVLMAFGAANPTEAGSNFCNLYYRHSFRLIAQVPDRVGEVDTAGMILTVTSHRSVREYTVTERTQFLVNGNPGKFEDLQKGMRVSVVADGKMLSRVDARDFSVKKQ
jgi:hypothetical protein